MTMVDAETFTKYEGLSMLASFTVEPGETGKELRVTQHPPDDGMHVLGRMLGDPQLLAGVVHGRAWRNRQGAAGHPASARGHACRHRHSPGTGLHPGSHPDSGCSLRRA